jgi:hypothetical protein
MDASDLGREVPPSECIALIHRHRLSVVPPRNHPLSTPGWGYATEPSVALRRRLD